MAPLGRLYLDAFGEPGRTPTSRSIYATCLVWTSGSDTDLETLFGQARSTLGLRRDFEFHARKLTKREKREQLPRRLFEILLAHGLQLQVWCAVMHKAKSGLPPALSGKELTYELIRQIVERMSDSYLIGATLTFDDQRLGKKPSKVAQEFRAAVNQALHARGVNPGLAHAIPKPADRCSGLQLADLLAAAVVDPWPDCLALFTNGQIHSWRT
jgi:hypothetical protein